MNSYNLRLLAQELQYLRGLLEAAQEQNRPGKCAAYSDLIVVYENILMEAGYYTQQGQQQSANN